MTLANSRSDTTVSPTLIQAAYLQALAVHFRRYDHLEPPAMVRHDGDLQLASDATNPAKALADWAETLHGSRIVVRNINGEAYVYVEGLMFRYELRVWTVVAGLLPVLSDVEHFPAKGTTIAREVLRAYGEGRGHVVR